MKILCLYESSIEIYTFEVLKNEIFSLKKVTSKILFTLDEDKKKNKSLDQSRNNGLNYSRNKALDQINAGMMLITSKLDHTQMSQSC